MNLLEGYGFTDASVPDNDEPTDSIPLTDSVEYPCSVCGKEAGPYGGHGRKPTKCPEHKKAKSSGVRVNGRDANLAAQAAKTLSQINGMVALLSSAMGMFKTGGAIAGYNEVFEAQAFAALSTDPELCRMILKTGVKSAKVSLALAYGGMAVAVGPVAFLELKEKKEAREVKEEPLE
jgi:hypothetical protein